MALNADTLLDRLYLKSQITKWRVLAILFAVIAIIAFTERYSSHSPIEKDYVARISFDGIIDDDQKIYDMLDDIGDNHKIKAVIVSLDTPGGSAVGGEEVYLRLRQLAQKKPVVAVMRSIAASAGYMVALGADRIYAREGTITGSIGVLIEAAEVTDLAAKIGVTPIIIKSSPLKGSPSPFEKATPEAKEVLHDVIMDFYDHFVAIVAARRGLPHDKVVALADGRVYSGTRAVADKLVDAIGGEDEAMQWLVSAKHVREGLDIKDVQPEKETSLLDQLTQDFAGIFFQKSRSVMLDGLVAVWHPDLH
ncbi:MAG: signal peptide peptidase SppA [Pseudomonadota bacterium]|nr:signal peptide peptidase SppA [Pseudomonadota bacterium]